jgi:sialic acid synthase SpsE
MGKMVRDIGRVIEALGDGVKSAYESEIEPLAKMGKMIVLSRDITKGEKVTSQELEIRSPAAGLEPYYWDEIVGKRASRDLAAFEPLSINDFE